MEKQTFLQRILLKILKKLGLIKEFEVGKADMCKRAIDSGVCLMLVKFVHGTVKENYKK